MLTKWALLALIAVGQAGGASHDDLSAMDAGPRTLVAFEDLALRRHPSLAGARANWNVARGEQVQAGLYPNPVVGYVGEEIGNVGSAGKQGGVASQRFITGGKRRLDVAVAGRDVARAGAEYEVQRNRVLTDVRLRFFETLVAQRRVALTEQLAAIGNRLADSSQQLLAGRQISESDWLQAEVEAEQSRLLLDVAENRALASWRRLTASAGIGQLAPVALQGDLETEAPPYDWDACYAMILGGSPEMAAARARVEKARLAIARARRENVPDINLSLGAFHANASGDDTAMVQAGFMVPLFDRNQGRIFAAQSEYVAACEDIERLKLAIRDRLAEALRQFEDAADRRQRYEERIVPRARRSYELTAEGYRQGQVDYVTMIVAQRTYIRVSLSHLDALLELYRAVSQIEGYLLGGALETSR